MKSEPKEMTTWRLLDTPPLTAAENMALDDTLLELKGLGKTPNTIHFLQFYPKAVLVGYHQSIAEEVRSEFCSAKGIHINRRITGGGAILFDESQIGWEIICDKSFFNVGIPTNAVFKKMCTPVVDALAILGIEAVFRPRNDIEIEGRKISGTGGTESDGAFLFQGTMLVDFDVETMIKSLRIPVEKLKAKEIDSIKERVTCLKWELGFTPPLPEIKRAISTGFEKHLKIRLEPGGLTPEEEALFQRKLPYYRSGEWIDKVDPKVNRQEVVQAAYKSKAGMVRLTLVVNLARKRIRDLYITGDFLSFPPRALYDLESALRGAPLSREHLAGIIERFFEDGKIMIPGMKCTDFLKPLDQALKKISISAFGIPIEYCNQISVTNGSFEEVIRKKPEILLLPYCSKLKDCDLRNEKECRACGGCSFGPAWRIGLEKRLKPICVVSFEDLREELGKMKSSGVPAFIGCCCEPFFTKHVDDFEEAGIPGILLDIDNTTCYELDEAKAAYRGRFESQTAINIDLLKSILNAMDRVGI
jgi:lipoate-protein ligase A